MIDLLCFILGLVGLILFFRWLDKYSPDPFDMPQDYMG